MTTNADPHRPAARGCLPLPGGGFLVLVALLLALWAPAARAEKVAPESTKEQPQIGYVTQSGRRMPLAEYGPYQAARHRWLAGFVTTMSGLGVVTTGVSVLLIADYAGGLNEGGRSDARIAGGVVTSLGIAAVAAGAAVWHLGRQGLRSLESQLPMKDGIMPPMLAPSAFLLPDGRGGFSGGLGLAGRF